MPAGRPRVLVFHVGSIGDTVVSIPALRAVRRHFGPDAVVTMMHPAGTANQPSEVLDGSGDVDFFLPYPQGRTRTTRLRHAALSWLRLLTRRYDVAVYLAPGERDPATAARDRCFFRSAGIRTLIGFEGLAPAELSPRDTAGAPAPVTHIARVKLARIARSGVDVSREVNLPPPFLHVPASAAAEAQAWLARHRPEPGRHLIAIGPGSNQPANLWPIDRFVELGRRLLSDGRHQVVVIGGLADRTAARQLIDAWGDGFDATGQLSVLGTASLLDSCALLVGLDTGTTHLAAARGRTCVAIYGSRDNPGRFEPLGDGHVVLRHRVPCAGCGVILAPCPVAGHPCLSGITVDAVETAVRSVLARSAAAAAGTP